MKNEHVSENWLMIIERNDMDEITVKVEAKEKVSNEEAKKIAMDLQQKLRIATTLRMNVEILPPDSLPKQEGKVKRVIDRRS